MSFEGVGLHDLTAELAAGLKQVFFVRWQISMPLLIVLYEFLGLHIFTADETIDSINNLFRLMLAFEMSLEWSWIELLAAYFALWLDFMDIKFMSLLLILEYYLVANIALDLVWARSCDIHFLLFLIFLLSLLSLLFLSFLQIFSLDLDWAMSRFTSNSF